ncbi:TOMM system kinase/cyclase fusion protein [Aquimarina sp. 2201CG5-10]|uniref:TOMM system kinase/cyclase fusion protein n=1 Tax=Aquimarina callyspongiae TaxID=3098150 RepID=UPI002AB55BE9|nr:TOMM system kinase/cyclase fusion protein [Aquimarina sp. 2201CG5-10]MDY8136451.1 TOMM system kinase/cyclase fusion protein [Aquimarina sp. 2201CG5-10]
MKNISNNQEVNIPPEINNYILLEKIGEGGFGLVYKAQQISTNQLVAIKILKFKTDFNQQARKRQALRFERETHLCAKINHPNIVKLIDKGYTKTQDAYAVYEYISGETLQDYISKNKKLTPVEISELMGQILDALICAHTEGIVHRDLKPQNIMVFKTGSKAHLKILDFGIGTFVSDSKKHNYTNLTLTKEVIGTPAYSAPEQLRGEPSTIKSDLYAWGLIFIECLTGQPVIQGASVAEMFQQQLHPSNISIPASIAGHPLADLLRRVLEKNPNYRISDAQTIFEEYSKINFHSLVGELDHQNTISQPREDITLVNQFSWKNPSSEKRQITVLCIKLSLLSTKNTELDLETLDTIQKDQLNFCIDTAIRFGGYLAGKLTDNLIIYYGYPKVSDTDGRRAGRTALELISQIQKRSALLNTQHGISLGLRISMNSGDVLSSQNNIPEGVVPNIAFNLLYNTKTGTILVSETTKKILEPYLEFEVSNSYKLPDLELPVQSYLLTEERKSEAFSFLRPWSASRKMIGRASEFQQILTIWKTITSQKGNAILIEGQAGIGKSKLIYECKTNFDSDGYTIRECRCLQEHQNNALYPFLEIFKKHIGIHKNTSPNIAISLLEEFVSNIGFDPAETIPILCTWLSISIPNSYELVKISPDKQKEILLVILEKCLLHSEKAEKFVFIMEDLHWIDPTSLKFLTDIIDSIQNKNCLLLITSRPEFTSNLTSKRLQTIKLQSLTEASSKLLIETVIQPVDQKAIDYITERTDGIPLFIEELTQMLIDQNYLVQKNETYQLIDNLHEKSIPITLKELLHARLDGLGFTKETAQLAAAIGREFDYKLLVASSLQDEAMVQTNLETLIKANLIYRQRKVKDENYIFRHALIRDAAYEGMAPTYGKEVHNRIANTLKEEFSKRTKENPFEIGNHYANAENYDEAFVFGTKAIEKQIQNSSNEEALKLEKKIKEWLSLSNNDHNRLRKELDLNICILPAIFLKEGDGSNTLYKIAKKNQELIAQIKTQSDFKPDENLDTITIKNDWTIFSFLHAQSKNKEAQELGEKILVNAKNIQHHELEMVISSFLGHSYFIAGEITKSEGFFSNIIKKFDTNTDKLIATEYGIDPYIFATGMIGYTYGLKGYLIQAKSFFQKGITYSKTTSNDTLIITAYLFYISFLSLIDDVKTCKKYNLELENIVGDKLEATTYSHLFFMINDWVYGKSKLAEEKRNQLIEMGQSITLSYYEPSLVKTYIKQKKYLPAIDLLESSIDRQLLQNERSILPLFYTLLGNCKYLQEKKLSKDIEHFFNKAIGDSKKIETPLLNFLAAIDYSNILIKEARIDEAHNIFKNMINPNNEIEAYNLNILSTYNSLKKRFKNINTTL